MFDRAGAERLLAPGGVVATGTACVVLLFSFFLSFLFFPFFFLFFLRSFFVFSSFFLFRFPSSFFLLRFFFFVFLRHQFINGLKVRPTMDIVFEILDLYFGLL